MRLDDGSLAVIDLELIEPSLGLIMHRMEVRHLPPQSDRPPTPRLNNNWRIAEVRLGGSFRIEPFGIDLGNQRIDGHAAFLRDALQRPPEQRLEADRGLGPAIQDRALGRRSVVPLINTCAGRR